MVPSNDQGRTSLVSTDAQGCPARKDDGMTPAEVDALAQRFFAAIAANDVAAVRDCYDPAVTIWHNYDQEEQGLDANLAVLGWLGRHVRDLRYEEVRRVIVDDGFVQQHVLRGTTDSGAALEVPAMVRVFVSEGHVTRIEEYLDTAQVAELRDRRAAATPADP
jgi:ketosteroid isomerase-like protein